MKKRLPYPWHCWARSRQPDMRVRAGLMRGIITLPPTSVTVGSILSLMGMRPEVIRPTPPLARATK